MAKIPLKEIVFPGLDNTYTIPEIDSTLSTSGKAADAKKTGDEISELKEDFATMEYDGLVPSAEQIISDKYVEDSVPYHYRKTGGNGSDREYVDAIVGGTVNWNQLQKNNHNASGNGVDYVFSNGELTVSGSPSATSWWCNSYNNKWDMIAGHKYYVTVGNKNYSFVSESTSAFRWYFNTSPAKYVDKSDEIIAITESENCYFQLQTNAVESFAETKFKPQVFDLTAMFGPTIADYIYSLEQTTAGAGVAFFKSLFPKDYYPYDSGTLKSVEGLSAHKMVGFNQWDEETELGTIDDSTGQNQVSNTVIRTKNYIPVLPSTTYYFKSPYIGKIFFYDENKNFVSVVTLLENTTFTTLSNAAYIRFRLASNYGTAYNHDICINLSDPAKNGTYEPYKAHSYPLDDSLTLRGLFKLDANNNLYADGDTYDADGTVTRKYGYHVCNGTDGWFDDVGQVTTADGSAYCAYISKNSAKNMSASFDPKAVSNSFIFNQGATGNLHKGEFNTLGSYFRFILTDTTITNLTQLNTWLSGHPVVIVYELATPTIESADPYQHLQQCDPNSTEEYVSTGIVPIGHNTQYPENLKAKIEGLPWNFASLIAPTESAFVATRNYVTGDLFIVDNVLYKATSNIANGGTITPNTNCTATTLAEIISALA